MSFKVNFNGQSLGEEIAKSVSHGSALPAMVGTVAMIVKACTTYGIYLYLWEQYCNTFLYCFMSSDEGGF